MQQGESRIEIKESNNKAAQDVVVFQKYIEGIPLHGGYVTVLESPDGQIAQVHDDSSASLTLNRSTPAIDSTAAEGLIKTINVTGSTSRLVWFRLGNEAIPAWEVMATLADTGRAAAPTGLETVVDAMTGRILSQRQLDSKTYAPGSPEAADGVFPRIVINDAIGPAGSRAYAAPFDSVVAVSVGCSASLIADDVVLSARHCGIGAGDRFIFGDNSNNGGIFSATVQSSFLPAGNGNLLDGGDVSIHTLTAPVASNIATPLRLIDETSGLEGMVAATVGYGFNGVGSVGHDFTDDGRRWGGENIIDAYGSPADDSGSNIISTDFDDGTNSANTIPSSSRTPLPLEATTAPGDSGSPVMVQVNGEWLVAGVLSGGTTSTSVYGDISWWTGTAVFRDEIEARGGEFAGSTPPPPPPGAPTCAADSLNLAALSYVGAAGQNSSNDFAVSDGGNEIRLRDNTWIRTTNNFNLTADTQLQFYYRSDRQGEIQGIGFDENTTLNDDPRYFTFWGTQNWNGNGQIDVSPSYSGSGDWQLFTINVGDNFTGAKRLVFVNDQDSGSGAEGNYRCVRVINGNAPPPPPPPTCTVDDSFESGASGWSNDPASTCTTGDYVLGTPSLQETNGGVVTQVDGARTGSNALFTATNTSIGNSDVDRGNCILQSPTWSVGQRSDLSVWYFHGQRDSGDDSGDRFLLEVSTNGGNTWSTAASNGDTRSSAAWTEATATIPSGSDVRVRVQCTDGTNTGDLIECGIDDISICPQ